MSESDKLNFLQGHTRVIETANQIVGCQTIDNACARIFSQTVNFWFADPNKLLQIDDYEFQFYGIKKQIIMDWLIHECIWTYTCYTKVSYKEKYRTILRFADVKGSVEFKLRFFDYD